MLQGLVSGNTIATLDGFAFRKVMNTLLTVEAANHSVRLDNFDLSTRDNDPDQGVDAFIIWPTDTIHEFLLCGRTAVQYKSGKLSEGKLEAEFNKVGVQATLNAGGNYLVCVGHDYVFTSAEKLRKKLAQLCESRRINPANAELIVGGQIAIWVERNPPVIVVPELSLGLPGFISVAQWSTANVAKLPPLAVRLRHPFLLPSEAPTNVSC